MCIIHPAARPEKRTRRGVCCFIFQKVSVRLPQRPAPAKPCALAGEGRTAVTDPPRNSPSHISFSGRINPAGKRRTRDRKPLSRPGDILILRNGKEVFQSPDIQRTSFCRATAAATRFFTRRTGAQTTRTAPRRPQCPAWPMRRTCALGGTARPTRAGPCGAWPR